jgi:hypothetical protein
LIKNWLIHQSKLWLPISYQSFELIELSIQSFDYVYHWALTVNPCWPSVLTGDMGYALLTDDAWYKSQSIVVGDDYKSDPGPRAQGVIRPRYKREVDILQGLELADGNIIVDNGNSSRLLSDEEIELLGYERCATPECEAELAVLLKQQAALTPSVPIVAEAAISTAASTPVITQEPPASKPRPSVIDPTATVSRDRSDGHRRHHIRHAYRYGH